MKFFAVVVVLCTLTVAVKAAMTKEEMLQAIRPLIDGCIGETGATEADIDVMIRHVPALNRETKCLRACMMKKMEVLNADGKFVKENALKIAEFHAHGDPEKMKLADIVISVCKDIAVPDDHCEAAELYKMCITSEAKKHGFNLVD